MYGCKGKEIDNGTIEHQPFKRTTYEEKDVDVGRQEVGHQGVVEVEQRGVVEHEGVVEVGHQEEEGHQEVVEHQEVGRRDAVEVEQQEVGHQGVVKVGHRVGAEVEHHKLHLVEL